MIKNRLPVLMAENGIKTMTELSAKTGLDKNTISNWYNQKLKRYSTDTLNTLCNFFNCQVGDLLIYVQEEETEFLQVAESPPTRKNCF